MFFWPSQSHRVSNKVCMTMIQTGADLVDAPHRVLCAAQDCSMSSWVGLIDNPVSCDAYAVGRVCFGDSTTPAGAPQKRASFGGARGSSC